MCLRNGDLGFHWCALQLAEGLEGVVVVLVVVVSPMGFLLSVG